jgi:hypothetical protein
MMNPANWELGDFLPAWFDNLTTSSSSNKARGMRSLAILVVWSSWMERNARIFKGTSCTDDQLFSNLQDNARTWVLAGAKNLQEVFVASLSVS